MKTNNINRLKIRLDRIRESRFEGISKLINIAGVMDNNEKKLKMSNLLEPDI